MLPRMTPSALMGDLVGLLAADARQRRERAIVRGGPARGWQSLVDVAAAVEALAASGAAQPRECAAMRRVVRGQIARATTADAPAVPPEVAARATRLLERSDREDTLNAIVELGVAGELAEGYGRSLAEPPGIGAVEPVFRGPPEMSDVPDRSHLERVLIAPAHTEGGVRLCSVECYAGGVLARYRLDADRFDPGERPSGTGYTIVMEGGEESDDAASARPPLLPPGRLSDDLGTVYRFGGGGKREMWWAPGVPPGASHLRVQLGRLDVELPLDSRPDQPPPHQPPTQHMTVEDAIDRHLWRRLLLLWRWRDDALRHLRGRLETTLNAMLALELLDAAAAQIWAARIERAAGRRRRSRAPDGANRAAGAHLADLVEQMRRSADVSQFASEVVRLFAAAGILELAGLVSGRSAEDARAAARRESWAREPRPLDVEHREPGELRRVIIGPRRRAGGLRVTSVEMYDTGVHVHLHHDGALDPPPLARPWPAVLNHFSGLPTQLKGPALSDDHGTRYTITTISRTPSGLELDDVWTGTLTAQPAPPRSAGRLTLTHADRRIELRL